MYLFVSVEPYNHLKISLSTKICTKLRRFVKLVVYMYIFLFISTACNEFTRGQVVYCLFFKTALEPSAIGLRAVRKIKIQAELLNRKCYFIIYIICGQLLYLTVSLVRHVHLFFLLQFLNDTDIWQMSKWVIFGFFFSGFRGYDSNYCPRNSYVVSLFVALHQTS